MKKKLQLALSNEIIQKKASFASVSRDHCYLITRRRRTSNLPASGTALSAGQDSDGGVDNKLYYSTSKTVCSINNGRYSSHWCSSNNVIELPSSSNVLCNNKSSNITLKVFPTSCSSFHTTRCLPLPSPSTSDPKKSSEKNLREEPSNGNIDNRNNDLKIIGEKSILSILRPDPLPNPPEIAQMEEEERKKRGNVKPPLWQRLASAWNEYKSTWDGFFDNHGQANKDAAASESGEDDGIMGIKIDGDKITKKQKDIQKNMKRNVRVLKKEGAEALEVAQELTGIRTKKDLTAWSMEQLKLANECVAQFMMGYRSGRDEEIDKVMNEYFKDFEFEGGGNGMVEDEKPEIQPGRKRRRRKSKW